MTKIEITNAHDILGVSHNASEAEIKAAYRKAAKKYHPDKQNSDRNRERASLLFPKIQESYETLMNESSASASASASSNIASPVISKPKKRMNPPPSSPSTRTSFAASSTSTKKQSVTQTPTWRKDKVTVPSSARSHRRTASSPLILPPLSVKKSTAPGSPGPLREKSKGHRRSRSSVTIPTPPPRPPMDSPLSLRQRKRTSHAAPPPPLSLSPKSSSKHLIPRKMQIKPATAPAPPQNAIQRLSVKFGQSRKEKKAEKKERQSRLLQ